jgi:hypothetical protein
MNQIQSNTTAEQANHLLGVDDPSTLVALLDQLQPHDELARAVGARVVELLGHPDLGVRRAALRSIDDAQINSPELPQRLLGLLSDPDRAVVEHTALLLARADLSGVDAEAPLRAALSGELSVTQTGVAVALWRLGRCDDRVRAIITGALFHPYPPIHGLAMCAVSDSAVVSEADLNRFIDSVDRLSVLTKLELLNALPRRNPRPARLGELANRLLNDPDPIVVGFARSALLKLSPTAADNLRGDNPQGA